MRLSRDGYASVDEALPVPDGSSWMSAVRTAAAVAVGAVSAIAVTLPREAVDGGFPVASACWAPERAVTLRWPGGFGEIAAIMWPAHATSCARWPLNCKDTYDHAALLRQ